MKLAMARSRNLKPLHGPEIASKPYLIRYPLRVEEALLRCDGGRDSIKE